MKDTQECYVALLEALAAIRAFLAADRVNDEAILAWQNARPGDDAPTEALNIASTKRDAAFDQLVALERAQAAQKGTVG